MSQLPGSGSCSGRWIACFVVLTLFGSEARAQGEVLHLERVLKSVQQHHPEIQIAVEQLRQGEGRLLSNEGGFDPQLELQGKARSGGYYELRRIDVGVTQPTPLWGTELSAGYRLGLGIEENRYPTYYEDETLDSGEVLAGLNLPLWRGGPTDTRRASIEKQQQTLDAMQAELHSVSLTLELQAIQSYWQWIRAGLSRKVELQMLALAQERDRQLKRRLQAGVITEFDLWDNERMVLERRERVILATRLLQRTAYTLGMFLRGDNGEPLFPKESWLPTELSPPPEDTLAVHQVTKQVLLCHPVAKAQMARVQAYGVDVNLAENQLAPQIDASVGVSRDLGDASRNETLVGTVFEGGVTLKMPLLLRPERGRLREAKSARAEAIQKLRYVRDTLRTQLHDAASEVNAAKRQAKVAKDLVHTAERLAAGERKRFDSGVGNLMFVNLREQSAASANLDLIFALSQNHAAWARWRNLSEVKCAKH